MKTERICVFGIVQGVGFRPFVSRLAAKHGLGGTVCNKGSYVEIIAQGADDAVEAFCRDLPELAPERSAILKIDRSAAEPKPYGAFDIVESAREEGHIFVSPDIAVCDACKAELFDPSDRRYLHPFINCTACGPRLTILDAMPYDRERTSMGAFPMCPACEYEYTHAETRRYDAQPVCCNDCGPEVYLLGRTERRREAITEARRIIADGGIVAVKGIGGFHLCCDAGNEDAVRRLRQSKRRPVKPLAVMMRDMDVVRRECVVEAGEEEILDGCQKPILLMRKKDGGRLCPSIAPGNPKVGVMLPYAPLQLLLFTYDDGVVMPDCLVMTSANESGAPICRTDDDAKKELSSLCDAVLSHNRRIRLRADDSVMDFYGGEPYMIRRSRGYAPLPFFVGPDEGKQVLAVGGELKNTFCLAKGNLYYLSPYIGDLSDARTVDALRESAERMASLLEATPSAVVCDTHPQYNSVAVAGELGLPVLKVQHHYAHVLSCMAENNYLEPVIGVSFDGTGYGGDGTIWGGEVLLADVQGCSRFASIMPFRHVGGDAASREGWRIAVSLLYDGTGQDKEKAAALAEGLRLCSREELQAQFFLADNGINTAVSTSAGRLFDGLSAALGLCRQSTFEGQGAMALQFAAEAWEQNHGEGDVVPVPLERLSDRYGLATQRLFEECVQSYVKHGDAGREAYAFHRALAGMVLAAARQAREETGRNAAALSGGVFQNTLLLRLCCQALERDGFTVLRHRLVPPNDGGLALGQALYGMYYLQ